MNTTDKINATLLTSVLKEKGLKHIVLCPGSRNAPLVISFTSDDFFKCYSIVDERSAAFFALGLAQQSQETVTIVCTSGSAALNFAPAIAEAYYQRLPLLVITADRPNEWVNQGESQTLQQKGIFENYVRASYDLAQEPKDETDLWFNQRQIAEAIDTTRLPYYGPVHINVRFREPLYNKTTDPALFKDSLSITPTQASLSPDILKEKKAIWDKSDKIMIICGQLFPDKALNNALKNLSKLGIVVLTESTSNLSGEDFIPCIDKVIIPCSEEMLSSLEPQLLITIGGPLISRKIKNYLRKIDGLVHWHVDPLDSVTDAFQHQKAAIPMLAVDFLNYFAEEKSKEQDFLNTWLAIKNETEEKHSHYFKSPAFSDLSSVEMVLRMIPEKSFVQTGNSASIRYVQLFDNQGYFASFCNRGTSGIEGSVSTAVGMSVLNEAKTFLIIGDLSLRYDSNGLWNNFANGRLKIIVLNNGGGGIFRIIEGPDTIQKFEEFIETKSDSNFEKFAACYNLNYFIANSLDEIRSQWKSFSETSDKASLLEINTAGINNAGILKDYFEKITTHE